MKDEADPANITFTRLGGESIDDAWLRNLRERQAALETVARMSPHQGYLDLFELERSEFKARYTPG